MTECARQCPSQPWWSRESAALTEMLVAGETLPLQITLTGAWPPSLRDLLTFLTRHTEHPWAMLTLISSTLAVGNLALSLSRLFSSFLWSAPTEWRWSPPPSLPARTARCVSHSGLQPLEQGTPPVLGYISMRASRRQIFTGTLSRQTVSAKEFEDEKDDENDKPSVSCLSKQLPRVHVNWS